MVAGDAAEEEEATAKHVRAGQLPLSYTPSAREVDEHECTGHAVYRTWCRTCVLARGVGQLSRRLDHDPSEVRLVALDFGFLSGSNDSDKA
eukprot:2603970-Amphidinium_carterae.1